VAVKDVIEGTTGTVTVTVHAAVVPPLFTTALYDPAAGNIGENVLPVPLAGLPPLTDHK
jgi:hypothetical protein